MSPLVTAGGASTRHVYERPDWVRRLIASGPACGDPADVVPLDADDLIARASRSTGLDDFGEPTWEEPFRRLVAALDGEAKMHVLGRLLSRHDLLRHLRTRLLVLDACRRNPAVGDEQVLAPVVVTGPARSGTSILQELLAQDPQLRGPLAWEMAHPIPPPSGQPDERADWAELEFDFWGDIQPEFNAVHELDARLPEECLWLVAPEFDMGYWSTTADIPQWFGWLAGTDPLPSYRFHKLFLQLLQHGRERRTWALKSPVHIGRLPALFAVYPDARVIHTHRDPVKTIPSSASTVYTTRFLRSDAVEPTATGATVGFGLQMILTMVAEARNRGELPEDQIADLHYLDLLRDPVDALRRAYDHLGLPFSDELPDRITGYLAKRPQNKHGTHRYDPADFGMDPATIRADFATYLDRYGVETED